MAENASFGEWTMSDAPTPAPSEPQAPTISFDDFAKLDLRVAKVLEAHDHPNADRLIVLKIDLGTEQRQLVAGLRGHYEPADLVGRLIVVVKNLAPRKMRGEESQGMLLAASDDGKNQVILLSPERDIAPGAAVS
ncbi:MAG: methionine--tRNA ligase subunit beta [Planctomycetota bacterium]|nr:methionine--tRNA ligase subunit beta [Planctomycetota bacterium]